MKHSNFIGWDIGGAHLKVVSVNESGKVNFVGQYASPLWQGLQQLEDLFSKTLAILPEGNLVHAVTITAELVDIFKDREEGVNALINVCEKELGSDVCFYAINESLIKPDDARKKTTQLASTNWHASTSYVASLCKSGLFVDTGSTTTDIIPFNNGQPENRGLDDQSRLRFDELVYTGVIRTSLMALASKVPFRGEWQNIAAEHFATTADVYRILSCIEDSDDLMDTADGKAKDLPGSYRRLARMVGTDYVDTNETDCWINLAKYYEELQIQMLTKAILRVLSNSTLSNAKIVGAGTGHFLIRKIAQRINIPYVEFTRLCHTEDEFKKGCNVCAPATAIAQLNRQHYIS
jgi:probable H4MPT-linked C1 transfer pathway protein